MEYWPAILAGLTVIVLLTTIVVNLISIKDSLDKHNRRNNLDKANAPEKVDEPNE